MCNKRTEKGVSEYDNAKRRSVTRESFLENWNFYLNFPVTLQCSDYLLPKYDPNGEDGKYTFVCMENGLLVPTKEFELVKRVQEGKMSVNLQMKLWSDDVGILLMPDELLEYCKGMPKWVFSGTMNQSKKRIMKEIGFIPSFMKLGDLT